MQTVETTTSSPNSTNAVLPAVFSATEMLSFGYFLRDNFYVDGSPKLKSYNTNKYPHSLMPEIFNYWCLENGR